MRTCDRCGKEFDLIKDLDNTNMCIAMTYNGDYPNVTTNMIWICPDCQEELSQWIEKGVQHD